MLYANPQIDAVAYYAVQDVAFSLSGCTCKTCGDPILKISDADLAPKGIVHAPGLCKAAK